MKILAIHAQHNATCAYMVDGQIKAVVSEEKFSNIKNDASFPVQSISYIIDHYQVINFDAVIICAEQCSIVENGKQIIQGQGARRAFFKNAFDKLVIKMHEFGASGLYRAYQNYKFNRQKGLRQKAIKAYIDKLDLFKYDEFIFYDHHDCHAYASYGALRDINDPSEALVLTADGQGDFSCARVYKASNKGLVRIANSYWTNSIGELYGKMTKLLGMKQLEHEYKVMGLAPYAEDKDYYKATRDELFEGLVKVNDDLTFSAKYPMHLIDKILAPKIAYHRFDNIAAALQTYTEDLITTWVSKCIAKTGLSTVYTGGGLFMNVKANKRIEEMTDVGNTHFMPSCGDESLPIGGCYKYYFDQTGDLGKPLSNIYLGPEYSNDEINSFIKENNLNTRYEIEFIEDMDDKIADLLAEGKVVARFQGRTEWGARSLGNRAILARPDRMESFFKVNDQVKMRDFWMPFAPSMLRETYQNYIEADAGQIAPYMITSFDSLAKGRTDFCAAIHNRDKTLRAQIVDQHVNPKYHYLISKFHQLTGIGGVLNTSFNLHGYPLVCSPEQALFTIDKCHLKYLALENYLLIKK